MYSKDIPKINPWYTRVDFYNNNYIVYMRVKVGVSINYMYLNNNFIQTKCPHLLNLCSLIHFNFFCKFFYHFKNRQNDIIFLEIEGYQMYYGIFSFYFLYYYFFVFPLISNFLSFPEYGKKVMKKKMVTGFRRADAKNWKFSFFIFRLKVFTHWL